MKLNIKRFDKSLPLPEYDPGAACFDFYTREDVIFRPGEIKIVPLNVAIQIPKGYVILVFTRSSTPLKTGLIVPHGAGVCDPFYNGNKDEIMIEFMNTRNVDVKISRGGRVAQGMVLKTEGVEWDEKDSFAEKGIGGYKLPNKE